MATANSAKTNRLWGETWTSGAIIGKNGIGKFL